MPTWNVDYVSQLRDRLNAILGGLDDRLTDVVEGRVIPAGRRGDSHRIWSGSPGRCALF